MLRSIIVAAGLMTGGVFLASAASASEAGLAPEAAAMVQPARYGYGGHGGWGRGHAYRGYGRPHHGWGYGHRRHHHGWGRGYRWGSRGYL